MNNFETITVDLRENYTSPSTMRSKFLGSSELEFIARASLPGVNRVIFALDCTRDFLPLDHAIKQHMENMGFVDPAQVKGDRYGPEKWIVCYERPERRRILG